MSRNAYILSWGQRRPYSAFLFQLSDRGDQRMETVVSGALQCRTLWLWGQLDEDWIPTLAPVLGRPQASHWTPPEDQTLVQLACVPYSSTLFLTCTNNNEQNNEYLLPCCTVFCLYMSKIHSLLICFYQVTKFSTVLHFRHVDLKIYRIHRDVMTLSLPTFPKEVYFFVAIRISKPRLPPLLSTALSIMKQNFCSQDSLNRTD